jgi:hypothetical protein
MTAVGEQQRQLKCDPRQVLLPQLQLHAVVKSGTEQPILLPVYA